MLGVQYREQICLSTPEIGNVPLFSSLKCYYNCQVFPPISLWVLHCYTQKLLLLLLLLIIIIYHPFF